MNSPTSGDFLDRVVLQKKAELSLKKEMLPRGELEKGLPPDEPRDFKAAISGGTKIIAEIKKKSPSVAAFRQGGAPEKLAAIYDAHGAAAISIVTDTPNFGTSLADVGTVRGVSSLPVLVKEFVIDSYQAIEARAAGADALLLIARLLDAPALEELLRKIRALGMAALVECHDGDDVRKALDAGADIVGINNRNLASLEVTLDTTRNLLPLIPAGVVRVAESGIDDAAQIAELGALGADAFLIGGSLLQSSDPARKLSDLLGGAS